MEILDARKINIQTSRITLRAFKEDDFNDFYDYAKDNVGITAGWRIIDSQETAKLFLKHFIEDRVTLAIVYQNKVVGNISFKLIDEHSVKIGYVLGKGYWHKGIMSESLKALIDYFFNNLKFDTIYAEYLSTNLSSAKVLASCGFKVIKKTKSKLQNHLNEESYIALLRR